LETKIRRNRLGGHMATEREMELARKLEDLKTLIIGDARERHELLAEIRRLRTPPVVLPSTLPGETTAAGAGILFVVSSEGEVNALRRELRPGSWACRVGTDPCGRRFRRIFVSNDVRDPRLEPWLDEQIRPRLTRDAEEAARVAHPDLAGRLATWAAGLALEEAVELAVVLGAEALRLREQYPEFESGPHKRLYPGLVSAIRELPEALAARLLVFPRDHASGQAVAATPAGTVEARVQENRQRVWGR
jgi:hypothetical protein